MKRILLVAAMSLAIYSVQTFAQELKIGFIDMNKIVQNSSVMKSLNESLVKKFQPRQDEINKATTALQNEVNQLTYSSSLSDDEKNNLQNKVITDKANLDILNSSLQRDIAIAKANASRAFMTKFASIVQKIATDGNYDFIEQNSNVLYMNKKVDITQQVLDQMK